MEAAVSSVKCRGRARGRPPTQTVGLSKLPGGDGEIGSSLQMRGRARGRPDVKSSIKPGAAGPVKSDTALKMEQQMKGLSLQHGSGDPIDELKSTAAPSPKMIELKSTAAQQSTATRTGASSKPPDKPTQKHTDGTEDSIWTKPGAMTTKRGTTGTPVRLLANYFKLLTVTNWQLYQYRVDFAPEEDRTSTKIGLLKMHKPVIGGYLFDGTVMFTSTKLAKDPMEVISERSSDDAKIRITIRFVGTLETGDYHYSHFFNILMRRCLEGLSLQLVGRHYFDALAKVPVTDYRLELWPGYVTSIRQHEDEILLCTELTHKVMRQESALDILTKVAEKNASGFQVEFKKHILGSIVLTDYNNKTYRVDDVDFRVTPRSTFERDGKDVSYSEYYRLKYEIKIKCLSQPLLVSLPKQRDRRRGFTTPIYLIPELCRMTGITDDMRSDFKLMRAVADHTRLPPKERQDGLARFQERINGTPSVVKELREWNMRLSDQLIPIAGRILPPERICLGLSGTSNIQCDPGVEKDWTRQIKNQPMLNAPNLEYWSVVVPHSQARTCAQYVAMLRRAAASMNFNIKEPFMQELIDDNVSSYVEAMDHLLATKQMQICLLVLPTRRVDRYSAVKKKCCVDRGLPTQVVISKNMDSKNVMSIASKMAIQICCKIGGAPWTVEIPLSGLMVIGFDVYHDTSTRGISIGALVASMDRAISCFFSAVSYQKTGEELSNEFSVNIVKALHRYKKYNGGQLPQRIVVYRDGVGEGQIPYVFQHEVELLKSKLAEVYCGRDYKMAFIIVTKRINTRLFCGTKNPPPGTIVDDTITMPQRYDFFLVSQSVRQGTVSPTSYNVIYDNVGLDPDKLQRLTYKLTHLYYNWSGTVRVPAPVQYAHKLAFLVGQSLHKIPSTALEDLLYFL